MKRDTISCLQSWSDELLSKADRVRNLIGDKHWVSDGYHKEELVRQFLIRHLPSRLRITRGFICHSDHKSNVSPEIDVLISNRNLGLPWFVEGELVIVPPSCAVGQIHVKTKCESKEVNSVLETTCNVFESCEMHRNGEQLWSGAVFFDDVRHENAKGHAQKLLNYIVKYLDSKNGRSTRAFFPDCLAIVNGPITIFDKESQSGQCNSKLRVRMFECQRLSVAIFLSLFFDTISQQQSNRRSEWTQFLQSQEYIPLLDEFV
jgi:hypothetical protein